MLLDFSDRARTCIFNLISRCALVIVVVSPIYVHAYGIMRMRPVCLSVCPSEREKLKNDDHYLSVIMLSVQLESMS